VSEQEKPEAQEDNEKKTSKPDMAKEVGGREGPEPTRYGDWEKNGIISDF
jgi:hypothetical protein